jgi:3-hexulose-6-phosphate synthase
MMKMKKPWVQIAIDVREIKKAEELAAMAVKAGADWVEAGTPLIVYESIRSIGKLVSVCKKIPVIADFKAQDGVFKYFMEASRLGGGAAVVLGTMDDGSIKEAVRAKNECGIQVIADMYSIKQPQLVQRAKELEALGVDYIMLHLGFDESKYNKSRRPSDGLKEVTAAVKLPVGVGVFSKSDSLQAVKDGASWIILGEPVLSAPDALEQMTDIIRAVKALV